MLCVVSLRTLLSPPRGKYLCTCSSLMKASDLIPSEPIWTHTVESELPPRTEVPLEMAKRLERLSLVNFEDVKAIERLESAIRFADQIQLVNTEGVEKLVSVLENAELPLRNDDVIETDASIISLAKETFEGYYVSPTGNIAYAGEDIPKSKKS